MNQKRHASQQSLNAAVKSICDVMRRSNCAGAVNYVPELTWILFLRILDEREAREAEEAAALGLPFTPSLSAPFPAATARPAESLPRQTCAATADRPPSARTLSYELRSVPASAAANDALVVGLGDGSTRQMVLSVVLGSEQGGAEL